MLATLSEDAELTPLKPASRTGGRTRQHCKAASDAECAGHGFCQAAERCFARARRGLDLHLAPLESGRHDRRVRLVGQAPIGVEVPARSSRRN